MKLDRSRLICQNEVALINTYLGSHATDSNHCILARLVDVLKMPTLDLKEISTI